MVKRENSYDWLRVIACFGVIVIHVGSRYPGRNAGGI